MVIGSYNPLDSSVQGYPVFVSNKKDSDKNHDVSLKVSAGNLIQWDSESGGIIQLGKTYNFSGDANIYWSPLENGKIIDEATIYAGFTDALSEKDTITIAVKKENDVFIAKRVG